MDLTHLRAEDGHTTLVTTRAALDEINAGMMSPTKRLVRQMSAARSSANIEYRDGRKVDIRPATLEEIAEHATPKLKAADGRRIVTVKGKRYIVASSITPARPWAPGAKTWTPEAYVRYWCERNGAPFGQTRSAYASCKAGTVGAGIWAAVNA